MDDTTPIHLRALFDKLFERLANSTDEQQQATLKSQILKMLVEVSNLTSAYVCQWHPQQGHSQVIVEFISHHANYLERKSDLWETHDEDLESDLNKIVFSDNTGVDLVHVFDLPYDDVDRQNYLGYGACTVAFSRIFIDGKLWGFLEMWESRYNRKFTIEEESLFVYVANKWAQYLKASS